MISRPNQNHMKQSDLGKSLDPTVHNFQIFSVIVSYSFSHGGMDVRMKENKFPVVSGFIDIKRHSAFISVCRISYLKLFAEY